MSDAPVELTEAFAAGVEEMLERDPELWKFVAGQDSEQLEASGRRAARSALAPFVWRLAAGEALETSEVADLLHVSRQALHKRVESGSLLGLKTQRTTLYPAWQFDGSAARPVVAAIVRTFRECLGDEYDARLVASWATTHQTDLDGWTPAEWLQRGRDDDAVVTAAERAGRALAQ